MGDGIMIPLPTTLRPYLLGAAGIAVLAAAIWVWRIDSLRASHKVDAASVRREYDLFREQVEAKATQALIAQKAVNAAQEQKWKEEAHAADQSIDDLRARLRTALLRPEGPGGGASRRSGAAAEADRAGVPAGVPPAAGSAEGSVCVNPDMLAGLAAYAIQAHAWAVSVSPEAR